VKLPHDRAKLPHATVKLSANDSTKTVKVVSAS
jgi:hypothetical protein